MAQLQKNNLLKVLKVTGTSDDKTGRKSNANGLIELQVFCRFMLLHFATIEWPNKEMQPSGNIKWHITSAVNALEWSARQIFWRSGVRQEPLMSANARESNRCSRFLPQLSTATPLAAVRIFGREPPIDVGLAFATTAPSRALYSGESRGFTLVFLFRDPTASSAIVDY